MRKGLSYKAKNVYGFVFKIFYVIHSYDGLQ